MGATEFMIREKSGSGLTGRKGAMEAFSQAVESARYDYGHSGYTGTIAEKCEFRMIPVPAGTNPEQYADKLLRDDDPRIADKWGPAGCIDLGNSEYLFFGIASC